MSAMCGRATPTQSRRDRRDQKRGGEMAPPLAPAACHAGEHGEVRERDRVAAGALLDPEIRGERERGHEQRDEPDRRRDAHRASLRQWAITWTIARTLPGSRAVAVAVATARPASTLCDAVTESINAREGGAGVRNATAWLASTAVSLARHLATTWTRPPEGTRRSAVRYVTGTGRPQRLAGRRSVGARQGTPTAPGGRNAADERPERGRRAPLARVDADEDHGARRRHAGPDRAARLTADEDVDVGVGQPGVRARRRCTPGADSAARTRRVPAARRCGPGSRPTAPTRAGRPRARGTRRPRAPTPTPKAIATTRHGKRRAAARNVSQRPPEPQPSTTPSRPGGEPHRPPRRPASARASPASSRGGSRAPRTPPAGCRRRAPRRSARRSALRRPASVAGSGSTMTRCRSPPGRGTSTTAAAVPSATVLTGTPSRCARAAAWAGSACPEVCAPSERSSTVAGTSSGLGAGGGPPGLGGCERGSNRLERANDRIADRGARAEPELAERERGGLPVDARLQHDLRLGRERHDRDAVLLRHVLEEPARRLLRRLQPARQHVVGRHRP